MTISLHTEKPPFSLYPSLNSTLKAVQILFNGKDDRAGERLFNHFVRVTMKVVARGFDANVQIAALLHDTVEDIPDLSVEHLRAAHYPESVCIMVDLLTRRLGQSYESYIDRIIASDNLGAVAIKLADNEDNQDPERWARAVIPAPQLLERYKAAEMRLKPVYRALAGTDW